MYELDVNATLVGFMGFLRSRETVNIINNNNRLKRERGANARYRGRERGFTETRFEPKRISMIRVSEDKS